MRMTIVYWSLKSVHLRKLLTPLKKDAALMFAAFAATTCRGNRNLFQIAMTQAAKKCARIFILESGHNLRECRLMEPTK